MEIDVPEPLEVDAPRTFGDPGSKEDDTKKEAASLQD